MTQSDAAKIQQLEQKVAELESELLKAKRNQDRILKVLENNQEQLQVLRQRIFNDGNHNN